MAAKNQSSIPAPWEKKSDLTDLPIPPAAPSSEETSEQEQVKTEAEIEAEAKAKLEAEAEAKAKAEAEAQAKSPLQDQAQAPTAEVMVTVTVPKGFKLRINNHHTVDYKAGVQEMPLEHAEHWYSKAHKVTQYQK